MFLPSRKRRVAKPIHSNKPDASASTRPPGRPMKPASGLKASQKLRTQQGKLLHSQATAKMAASARNRLSTLESLPVEIIQNIFFHAFEVNMPRSSPYLAQALSNRSIYNALILLAYFDDDNEGPVNPTDFLPAEYRSIHLEDKIRLQQGILGCRWFTLELLKSRMPALSRLQMVQAWHREYKKEQILLADKSVDSSNPRIPARFTAIAALPSLDDHASMESHFLANLEPPFYHDLSGPERVPPQRPRPPYYRLVGPIGDANTLPRIMEWRIISEAGQLTKQSDVGISILAARVIPDRVLRVSDWTDERLEFVQLLRQGMRFLTADHVLVISAAALFDGMATAIEEGNEKALLVLLELHNAAMPLRSEDSVEFFDSARPGTRGWVRPFAHPLPLRLFHLACERDRQKHQETETSTRPAGWPSLTARLLSLLIREGLSSIPNDDPVLTRWATHTATDSSSLAEDVLLARWLIRDMAGSSAYANDGDPRLFVDGVWSRPWRGDAADRTHAYPFAEHTFTDEIGYLYEGSRTTPVRALDGGPCG
ncbi:hypothetical protein PV11_05130 [Exophiala sideris]|uniref:Uncharacterized protein n=1 Tax=Exophiala sideris TaxID=1016849 RepID=A0A0D1W2Q9_9EURO|nr:hypothetical protein PV11_05130 [Exophiala sideris]